MRHVNSKLAWLVGKGGLVLLVAVAVASVFGFHWFCAGLWDGPH